MAMTPGSRPRGTTTGDDRNTLDPMQEPLGSMDRANTPGTGTVRSSSGRGFTATFAIAAVVLLVAFLIAIYFANGRSDVARTGGTQAPVADTSTGTANGTDQTGSTSTAPPQQVAPGTGNAGGGSTAPANP